MYHNLSFTIGFERLYTNMMKHESNIFYIINFADLMVYMLLHDKYVTSFKK
jgi:hypothetical protein